MYAKSFVRGFRTYSRLPDWGRTTRKWENWGWTPKFTAAASGPDQSGVATKFSTQNAWKPAGEAEPGADGAGGDGAAGAANTGAMPDTDK